METGANREQRTGRRSVVGSLVGAMLLAGLVALALELVAMVVPGPHSGAQALARSADGFVALERHISRGGPSWLPNPILNNRRRRGIRSSSLGMPPNLGRRTAALFHGGGRCIGGPHRRLPAAHLRQEDEVPRARHRPDRHLDQGRAVAAREARRLSASRSASGLSTRSAGDRNCRRSARSRDWRGRSRSGGCRIASPASVSRCRRRRRRTRPRRPRYRGALRSRSPGR